MSSSHKAWYVSDAEMKSLEMSLETKINSKNELNNNELNK